ncbi:response regulator [Nocardiopsis changdeensis]|uniref:Response regulator transcription factor n=1 Tax=Nocardiopsis changdeensis TaxID=2831969 RepID=A0ABX8BTL5_9ACTN|nr:MULTISPECIES: response regulator transcription factor [Nocardiopsis]QUX25419.1 response regulator transcription factor [Nocardiopsis changdeensis]QYX35805.1 response regulator transcription factor [Nocardiopsis sp. MT53]
MDRIRVLLADDDALMRAGLRAILAADPHLHVVAEAADGDQALHRCLRHRPDLALLDVRMPGTDGLAAARRIRARLPGTAIVMLTLFGEDENIDTALDIGVDGFVLKTGDPADLLAAATGAAFLSPPVARRVLHRHYGPRTREQERDRDRIRALTPRERQVLALVGHGETDRDIARLLDVAPSTVKTHLDSLRLRLGVHGRVHLALIAHRAGLTTGPAP